MALPGLLRPNARASRLAPASMVRPMFVTPFGPRHAMAPFADDRLNWHEYRVPVTGLYKVVLWGAGGRGAGHTSAWAGGGSGNLYIAERVIAGQTLVKVKPGFGYPTPEGYGQPSLVELGNGEVLIAGGGQENPPDIYRQGVLAPNDILILGNPSRSVAGPGLPGPGDNGGAGGGGNASVAGGGGAPGWGPFKGGAGGPLSAPRGGYAPGGGGSGASNQWASGGDGMVLFALMKPL